MQATQRAIQAAQMEQQRNGMQPTSPIMQVQIWKATLKH